MLLKNNGWPEETVKQAGIVGPNIVVTFDGEFAHLHSPVSVHVIQAKYVQRSTERPMKKSRSKSLLSSISDADIRKTGKLGEWCELPEHFLSLSLGDFPLWRRCLSALTSGFCCFSQIKSRMCIIQPSWCTKIREWADVWWQITESIGDSIV